jgi:hypothetical protein
MNPLDDTNIKDVKLKIERWQHLIKNNLAKIPSEVK